MMFNENEFSDKNIVSNPEIGSEIRSLKDLIDKVSGKHVQPLNYNQDLGLAEPISYPFLAIVGQFEMKLALTLTMINPFIGGVLLIGPRGTGKTTAVRSIARILPMVEISNCFYGCLPEDIKNDGLDSVCPECAKKYGQNIPLSKMENVQLIELPLNSILENVVGGFEDKQALHHRMRLKRGILASADNNILYIDEVNLLNDEIINSILDAAAMGKYTLRRGNSFGVFRSRFTLIGSMNPEEGFLRPQIMDRFGLRILNQGLSDIEDRLTAYQRSIEFRKNPSEYNKFFEEETSIAREEVQEARNLVKFVKISDDILRIGVNIIRQLSIDSLRAEITLFESAKALAAADHRDSVNLDDIKLVAPMALRLRNSNFMSNFFEDHKLEEEKLVSTINKNIKEN
ncbi:MAG: magnesium chelatase [Chloroflexi bacterium HGW-Chloroflexi-10]|nr:MAG: magnesium chelatase [Chloroflexi bacterium HGW-Chloroflexi-10]